VSLVVASLAALAGTARAYVEIPYTLGRCLQESHVVCLMEVTKVNKERRLIYYKKLRDIKGKHDQEEIKHQLADGFHPREPGTILAWADVGKKAVFLHNGGASQTGIDGYWYQAYRNNDTGWWGMTHGEPFFNWTFNGEAVRLAAACEALLAGKEIVVPATQFDPAAVDKMKQLMHERKAPLWRIKASLQLTDYNAMMAAKGKYVVGLGAGGGPPAVRFFSNEPQFVFHLTEGVGTPRLEVVDTFRGPAAVRLVGRQRYAPGLPNWFHSVVEKPEEGDYRYVRFAWKKVGGGAPVLAFCDGGAPARCYYAGAAPAGDGKAVKVADAAPAEWTVVTRDLFADFGAFTITGLGFANGGADAVLFDEIVLGRSVAEIDKLWPK
jgi:hypothetical protein